MNKTRTSLWIAGGMLMLSAIFSQILTKDIAQVLVLGLSGLGFTILGFSKQGRKQMACEAKSLKKSPIKSTLMLLGFTLFFGGLGYFFGQMLYHIIN
ncbi:hypothetical protein ACFSQJ_19410 [Croceitalea marina]|uniref:DUF202 domain-containing protein n=1 Tax=Croceitalea marina TaxID=1775166 RepID=A0ABW5N1Z3_9FLAO